MPMHRANTSNNGQRMPYTNLHHRWLNEPTDRWFVSNRRRQRRRNVLARQMRKIQRRIANGKRR